MITYKVLNQDTMATGRISMESSTTTFKIRKVLKMGVNNELIECFEVSGTTDDKRIEPFYVQMMSITASEKPRILAGEHYLEVPETGPWVVDIRGGKVVCWGLHETTDINSENSTIEIEGDHQVDALFGYVPLRD